MMMKFATLIAATSLALAPSFVGAQSQPAAAGGTGGAGTTAAVAEMKDAITGTMDIQFNTRTNLDSSGDLRTG